MSRKRSVRLAAVLTFVAAAACSAESDTGEPESATTNGSDGEVAPESGGVSLTEDAAILRAKGAVIDRTSARAQDISVVSVERVEWSDSSLGCPVPGQSYLTVMTPGRQIMLSWAGQPYDVRVADSGYTVVCAGPGIKRVRGEMTPIGRLTLGPAQAAARADLARQLGVPEEEIEFLGVKRRRFPDNTLGCPGSIDTVVDGPVSGYVFTLQARGQRYTYHSDLDRTVACPPFAEQ